MFTQSWAEASTKGSANAWIGLAISNAKLVSKTSTSHRDYLYHLRIKGHNICSHLVMQDLFDHVAW